MASYTLGEIYYLYQKKNVLNETYNEIITNINNEGLDLTSIEYQNGVIVAYTDLDNTIDEINDDIRSQLEIKKLRLNKFWITEDTLSKLERGSINKIYDQGITKYKVLTKFAINDGNIIAIALPLSAMEETILIINKFNILITIFALVLVVILGILLASKIVKPMEKLQALAKDIQGLNFRKEHIKTGDEVENLANSLNNMSEALEKAHNEINNKNMILKRLISDISHELKTPIALIKAYGQGVEDGIDDGTYIEEILNSAEEMNLLVEKLLYWAKIEEVKYITKEFNIVEMINNVLNKFKLIINESNIEVIRNYNSKDSYIINGYKDGIEIVLSNLISNAIKYTSNNLIKITIVRINNILEFKVSNGIGDKSKIVTGDIWRPFSVLEESRNKNLSGTGLGLSIVENILKREKLNFGVEVKEDTIIFYINFFIV